MFTFAQHSPMRRFFIAAKEQWMKLSGGKPHLRWPDILALCFSAIIAQATVLSPATTLPKMLTVLMLPPVAYFSRYVFQIYLLRFLGVPILDDAPLKHNNFWYSFLLALIEIAFVAQFLMWYYHG